MVLQKRGAGRGWQKQREDICFVVQPLLQRRAKEKQTATGEQRNSEKKSEATRSLLVQLHPFFSLSSFLFFYSFVLLPSFHGRLACLGRASLSSWSSIDTLTPFLFLTACAINQICAFFNHCTHRQTANQFCFFPSYNHLT